MVKIQCSRCAGFAIVDDGKVADLENPPFIDHSIGLAKGKPCEAGRASLVIIQDYTEDKKEASKPVTKPIPVHTDIQKEPNQSKKETKSPKQVIVATTDTKKSSNKKSVSSS